MLGDILKKITEKGRDLKIDAISIAAKPILQARVGQCAEIQDLRIDPAKKTISVTALLHGETEPIEAEVGYSKTDSGIKVERFQSNRQWLNLAARDHVIGMEFELQDFGIPSPALVVL